MSVWRIPFLSIALLVTQCNGEERVRLGNEVLMEEEFSLLDGKKVGLITNHTGVLPGGEFLVDVLVARGVNVVALFGPEHGIRGIASAGEHVGDTVDTRTGIRVYSLYGRTKKPTPAMLSGIDVLIYDVQDIGVRFYTYISTMALAMEAAAGAGIQFVVLDRPNPLGGIRIFGPVMNDTLKSFVGLLPIPVVYGLTCGELATMIRGERWMKGMDHLDLHIIRMDGWRRSFAWSSTGLSWIPPSPNIPSPQTVEVYPATCYLEATNISEGRGTDRPFETIGAPFIDGESLEQLLGQSGLRGLKVTRTTFTPTSSKFKGMECNGVRLEVTNQVTFDPMLTGLSILGAVLNSNPGKVEVSTGFFERLFGRAGVLEQITGGVSHDSIQRSWSDEIHRFSLQSLQYHQYAK